MDRILSSVPDPRLTHLVRAYAQRQVCNVHTDAQPVVASLEQVLHFEFGDPLTIEYRSGLVDTTGRVSLVGAHTSCRAALRFLGEIESFAVFFQPFGLWQLFGLPNHLMNNQAYDATDVFGTRVRLLWEQMTTASFQQRVAIVNRFLLGVAATASTQTPIMAAATRLFHSHGAVRVATMAHDLGLGVRQFERRFLKEAGLSPKLFGRISRFQMALDAKLRTPAVPWTTIAHQFGYHDQMHLIQDLRRLGGPTPGDLLASLGDGRPAALTEAESNQCHTPRGAPMMGGR